MVEGISLSADDDLHFQFMRNCAKAIFPVVRVNGKRVKLEYSPKKTKKKQQQKLMKFIRKVSKRRSKDNPTLEQAKKRKDWPKFEEAIRKEMEQMKEEGVFGADLNIEDVKRSGYKIIGTMIILTVKRLPDGTIDKYKARLVALGNQQKADQYAEISSPTARSASVKCLIALQAKTNAKSCAMDVLKD